MEYQATYGIDFGLLIDIGIIRPEHLKATEIISASHPKDAVAKAINMADEYSKDYLPNPETNYTTVKLMSLVNPYGQEIKQQLLINDQEIQFEDGCALIKRSWIEHSLNIEERLEEGA